MFDEVIGDHRHAGFISNVGKRSQYPLAKIRGDRSQTGAASTVDAKSCTDNREYGICNIVRFVRASDQAAVVFIKFDPVRYFQNPIRIWSNAGHRQRKQGFPVVVDTKGTTFWTKTKDKAVIAVESKRRLNEECSLVLADLERAA